MKFSVLLPTRNGGKVLGACMNSILNQPYEDMELIVSDNANTDESPAVIASFSGDHRLKVTRNEKPVSVTENWNNALYKSSGDYILMIGDDDFLLPGYFKRIEEIIDKYDYPEGITYNGYLYISPSAIDKNSNSYYSDPFFKFDPPLNKEGFLAPGVAHSIFRDMFDFNVRMPLNTLPHIWSRKAINRVDGDIFRPPYPDHFALNSLLLKSKTWVFIPDQLFIIGVSEKSYGHFVFSDTEQKEGADYLGISHEFEGKLPGNPLINNMHVWLNLLKTSYPEFLERATISRANYIRHQVYFWVSQYRHGSINLKDLMRLFNKLNLYDWIGLAFAAGNKKCVKVFLSFLTSFNANKINTFYYGPKALEGISSIEEFAEWVCLKKPEGKR